MRRGLLDSRRYENNSYLVFDENIFLVPVDNLRGDLEPLKDSNEPAKPNVARAQKNLALLASYDIPQTGPDVEINSRHVNFSQISRVVHVSEDHIDIFRGANA